MTEEQMAKIVSIARALGAKENRDICVYNGAIRRMADIQFAQTLAFHKRHDHLMLILVTNGGDPDAAYKMARYIQDTYERFSIFVTGLCKSAGTLIALGAHEIIFSPYGELGPMDVQKGKEDRVGQLQSGLVVTEALTTLENRAIKKYYELIKSIVESSDVISFPAAAKAATDMIHGLYAPIFSQIDPEDIGDKARAMRIAIDYGKRLAVHTENLKEKTLDTIAKTYSSHSFVIDKTEAETLFNNVRWLRDDEAVLMDSLDDLAIYQKTKWSEPPICAVISYEDPQNVNEDANEQSNKDNSTPDGGNTPRATASAATGTSRTGSIGTMSDKEESTGKGQSRPKKQKKLELV